MSRREGSFTRPSAYSFSPHLDDERTVDIDEIEIADLTPSALDVLIAVESFAPAVHDEIDRRLQRLRSGLYYVGDDTCCCDALRALTRQTIRCAWCRWRDSRRDSGRKGPRNDVKKSGVDGT